LIEAFDVSLSQQTIIRQPLPSCLRHPRAEHQQRRNNGDHEEDDETANLEPERLQGFAAIEDAIGDKTCENRALRKENWSERVRTLSHEAQTPTAIWMGRYEVQFDPIHLPEKSKPDQKPHVPTEQNELK
jgi:hypothetical protein